MAGVVCGKLDLTKLPQDELITINGQTWLAADVDEKFYILNGEPYVVIKFSNTCVATVCDDQNDLNLPLAKLAGVRKANEQSPPSEGGSSQSQTRSLPEDINNNNEEVKQAQAAVDANSIATFSWYGAAVKPAAAMIPMKSNIRTYGPYVSSNFGSSYGGTQVEVNTELCPWVFGSISAMNAAGASLVESAAIGLSRAETGSITIPGLPLSNLSLLGTALNSIGPTLSSLNFSYGSNGITTRYEFKTYTPKFGSMNKHTIDKIKNITKNRTEQLRFLRTNQITLNKISRKIRKIENPPRDNKKPDGTLQRVLVGEIYDWLKTPADQYTQCTIVGMDTLSKSVREMVFDYDKKAYVSLDALYGPISKNGDGGLPRYANFNVGCHKASPQHPQPPFAIDDNPGSEESNPFENGLNQYNLEITQTYIDPLTNPFAEDGHHHEGGGVGHTIDLIGRQNSIPEDGMITNFYHLDDPNRYSTDYRFLGMRGPLLLHSWGYDTEGKPIPNAADIESDTKNGIFAGEYLKDAFLQDWLGKPATWPVAPIDFRFDRKRGLWVSPPGYKVVVAILEDKLNAYGTATGSLINRDDKHGLQMGPDLYDKDGESIAATEAEDSEAKIKIVDRLGKSYNAGTRVYCYYDTFKCEYIILEAAEKRSIRFRLIDLCIASPNYGDDWTQYAGYGDKFPNNHILGIRIDCDGNPINNKGELINHDDITNVEKQKEIFINLFDTSGKFGSAYAYYDINGGDAALYEWKEKASTGFALLCDPPSGDTSCGLGSFGGQCSSLNNDYGSYDIIFLDSYARFVECVLTQKLYMTDEDASEQFSEDEYKVAHPEGNAAATILTYYGDPGNGREPMFYKSGDEGLETIDFRVFDPFMGSPKVKNPFIKLKAGDKVLAVFDEKTKKYIIYNSLRLQDKVVKFALAQQKKRIQDVYFQAVLLNSDNKPVDEAGQLLDADTFNNNLITVQDPYAQAVGDLSAGQGSMVLSGPAIGSDKFEEHINSIPELYDNEYHYGPFIGFALQEYPADDSYETGVKYTLMFLETFAEHVTGKIGTIVPQENNSFGQIWYGALETFWSGRVPFTRSTKTIPKGLNIKVIGAIGTIEGVAYYMGDFYDGEKVLATDTRQQIFNKVDGCKFVATLNRNASLQNNEDVIYTIVESETIARNGEGIIEDQTIADKLNSLTPAPFNAVPPPPSIFDMISDDSKLSVVWNLGWMWHKTKSKTNYESLVKLLMRRDWTNKPLLIKSSHFLLELRQAPSADPEVFPNYNGTSLYEIVDAHTIARIVEKESMGGTNASLSATDGMKAITSNDTVYLGNNQITALNLNKPPKIAITHPFMSYEGGLILSLLNEYAINKVEDQELYRVVYAREAPIIMTGTASSEFKPDQADNVSIVLNNADYASCPGYDKIPVIDLIVKAKNPMGYGALAGDLVTLQRVFSPIVKDNANYYYIVIGTGKIV